MLQVDSVIFPSILLPSVVAAYTFLFAETDKFFAFMILSIFSILAYLLTMKLIPIFKTFNLKADLFGYDINKKGTELGEKKM